MFRFPFQLIWDLTICPNTVSISNWCGISQSGPNTPYKECFVSLSNWCAISQSAPKSALARYVSSSVLRSTWERFRYPYKNTSFLSPTHVESHNPPQHPIRNASFPSPTDVRSHNPPPSLLWPVIYRRQSHGLLGRGFHTYIRNASIPSPTDVFGSYNPPFLEASVLDSKLPND